LDLGPHFSFFRGGGGFSAKMTGAVWVFEKKKIFSALNLGGLGAVFLMLFWAPLPKNLSILSLTFFQFWALFYPTPKKYQ
jgi:hypothetical protein